MKNFIFKSDADFHKIVFNKLEMLLAEQRKQRMDLTTIIRLITGIKIEKDLQKQVDDYFDDENDPNTPPVREIEDNPEHIPEV